MLGHGLARIIPPDPASQSKPELRGGSSTCVDSVVDSQLLGETGWRELLVHSIPLLTLESRIKRQLRRRRWVFNAKVMEALPHPATRKPPSGKRTVYNERSDWRVRAALSMSLGLNCVGILPAGSMWSRKESRRVSKSSVRILGSRAFFVWRASPGAFRFHKVTGGG